MLGLSREERLNRLEERVREYILRNLPQDEIGSAFPAAKAAPAPEVLSHCAPGAPCAGFWPKPMQKQAEPAPKKEVSAKKRPPEKCNESIDAEKTISSAGVRFSKQDICADELFERDEQAQERIPYDNSVKFSQKENLASQVYASLENEDPDEILRRYRATGLGPSSFLRDIDTLKEKTFTEKLLEYLISRNLASATVYKAANLDRKLFSKILSNGTYSPSKDTCVAICFALKLNATQALDMLERAGYTLSRSSSRDLLFRYCFINGIHKVDTVNDLLYRLRLNTLGGKAV